MQTYSLDNMTIDDFYHLAIAMRKKIEDRHDEIIYTMKAYREEKGDHFYNSVYKEYESMEEDLFSAIVHLEEVERDLEKW